MRMSFGELKKLWSDFEDVPIDKDECIDENFHIWCKDTDRYEIWHWFDDRLPHGLAVDLMGLKRELMLTFTTTTKRTVTLSPRGALSKEATVRFGLICFGCVRKSFQIPTCQSRMVTIISRSEKQRCNPFITILKSRRKDCTNCLNRCVNSVLTFRSCAVSIRR